MPAPKKPPLLVALAILGVILGSFGTLYALSSATQFLLSRDQFVAAYHEEAERLPLLVSDPKERAQFLLLADREAEVVYARRGVALPLAAMNLILSLLLFAGATQAMRGQAWGVSAWSLAAAANVPYTLLGLVTFLVESRELVAAYREAGGPMAELTVSGQHLKALGAMLKTTIEIVYFGAAWLYLRRPSLRKLFEA